MTDAPHIVLTIPAPPSVNTLWRSVNGRVLKSAGYRKWLTAAGWECAIQSHGDCVPGAYRLRLTMPATRGDLDNYCKAVSDLLQAQRIITDDELAEEIILRRDRAREDRTALVELWAVT